MDPLARTERLALAATLRDADPTAPTLCEGWTVADLAAHVVVRERRPDAALGAVVGRVVAPLGEHGERVRAEYAARPLGELADLVRSGPPALSPFAVPALDRAANGIEMFVHHEDVRRAAPGWEPRTLPPEAEDELWTRLRQMARLVMRGAPTRVVLRRPDGERVEVGSGEPTVTVTGPPSELVLFAHGRQAHARVTVDGHPQGAAGVRDASFGV